MHFRGNLILSISVSVGNEEQHGCNVVLMTDAMITTVESDWRKCLNECQQHVDNETAMFDV